MWVEWSISLILLHRCLLKRATEKASHCWLFGTKLDCFPERGYSHNSYSHLVLYKLPAQRRLIRHTIIVLFLAHSFLICVHFVRAIYSSIEDFPPPLPAPIVHQWHNLVLTCDYCYTVMLCN